MMKQKKLINTGLFVVLAGLTACSGAPSIPPEERAFLVEVRRAAEQARDEAVQAAQEAKNANQAAATAAATASSYSEKTSRIYERSQNK